MENFKTNLCNCAIYLHFPNRNLNLKIKNDPLNRRFYNHNYITF
jgi:hypothetical protein